jgi:hypothetical protein
VEQDTQSNTIRLEGAADIGCAADLKGALLRALTSGCEVRVALDGATDLDVTAIQLLWAAGREANASGVAFTFAGQVPEPISAALTNAGFEEFPFTR